MKQLHFLPLSLAILFFTTHRCDAQTGEAYDSLVAKASELYDAKQYRASADAYSAAFKTLDWKGTGEDRYNAACSWALAGVPDSAFFQLERLATAMKYKNYDHITTDTDLNSLHKDKRWKPLLEQIKENKAKAELNLNRELAHVLDSIQEVDQDGRVRSNKIQEKHGYGSEELKKLWSEIHITDSTNLVKVCEILDKYGWLSPDVVGDNGNRTLFLVIQHSDLATQVKYLPMMREAVKKGAAQPSHLALLEDRVALRQGNKQIYGSQISSDPKTGEAYVQPLDDPDHVDERRAAVGLEPLAKYVKYWKIKWDVEEYKKNLPHYLELQKK